MKSSNKRYIVIIGIVISIIVIGVFISYKIIQLRKNTVVGPIGSFSQELLLNRYKAGLAVRLYFKKTVTNRQTITFGEDIQKLPNVNGISCRPKESVVENIEYNRKVTSLTEQELNTIQGFCDVFVIKKNQKNIVVQYALNTGFIDRAVDINGQ
jgi:hypothetical protein